MAYRATPCKWHPQLLEASARGRGVTGCLGPAVLRKDVVYASQSGCESTFVCITAKVNSPGRKATRGEVKKGRRCSGSGMCQGLKANHCEVACFLKNRIETIKQTIVL